MCPFPPPKKNNSGPESASDDKTGLSLLPTELLQVSDVYMPMLIIIRVIWLKIMDECFIQADEQGEQPGVFNISGAAVNDEPIVSQPIGVSSTAGPEESTAIPMPYH